MNRLSNEFIKKIAHVLQEEEIDIYVMTLYCLNSEDLNYFEENDREKIKRIFSVLMEDTKHHAELLKLIVQMGER